MGRIHRPLGRRIIAAVHRMVTAFHISGVSRMQRRGVSAYCSCCCVYCSVEAGRILSSTCPGVHPYFQDSQKRGARGGHVFV